VFVALVAAVLVVVGVVLGVMQVQLSDNTPCGSVFSTSTKQAGINDGVDRIGGRTTAIPNRVAACRDNTSGRAVITWVLLGMGVASLIGAAFVSTGSSRAPLILRPPASS